MIGRQNFVTLVTWMIYFNFERKMMTLVSLQLMRLELDEIPTSFFPNFKDILFSSSDHFLGAQPLRICSDLKRQLHCPASNAFSDPGLVLKF